MTTDKKCVVFLYPQGEETKAAKQLKDLLQTTLRDAVNVKCIPDILAEADDQATDEVVKDLLTVSCVVFRLGQAKLLP